MDNQPTNKQTNPILMNYKTYKNELYFGIKNFCIKDYQSFEIQI